MRRDESALVRNAVLRFLASRVKLRNLILEESVVKVRVNLRCGDLGVTKHFLNRPQIGTALNQVGGKTVPERMRTDIFANPRRNHASLQHGEGHLTRHFASLTPQEQNVFVAFQRDDVGPVVAQIVID